MTSNSEIIINSLAEYIKKVLTMTEDFKSNPDDMIVYRGQGRAYQELIPYLFRKGNENIRENEARLLRDAEAAHPEEFSGLTTLDKLAKLQHYGFPTRLLDVTLNPLVALYFSVRSTEGTDNQNFDGSVILCRIPASSVEVFDSEIVVTMANLANLSSDMKYCLEHCGQEELKAVHREYKRLAKGEWLSETSYNNNKSPQNDKPQTQGSTSSEEKRSTPDEKTEKLSDKEPKSSDKEHEQIDSEQKQVKLDQAISQFFGLIKAEFPSFEESREDFITERMYKPVYVKTKQLNARIAAQNGAFLLFGLSNDARIFAQQKIIVSRFAKNTIRKELEAIGINEAALFPELDKFLNYLIKKKSINLTLSRHSKAGI